MQAYRTKAIKVPCNKRNRAQKYHLFSSIAHTIKGCSFAYPLLLCSISFLLRDVNWRHPI